MQFDQGILVRSRRRIPAGPALSPINVGCLDGDHQVDVPVCRPASSDASLAVAGDARSLVVDRAKPIASRTARLAGDPVAEEQAPPLGDPPFHGVRRSPRDKGPGQ
jgi:hypothetical protein